MKVKVTKEDIIEAIHCDRCLAAQKPNQTIILEAEEVKETLVKEETECYTKGYEECKRKALSFVRAMEKEL